MSGPVIKSKELTDEEVSPKLVKWEGLCQGGVISNQDLSLIRRIDKASPAIRSKQLSQDGPAYFATFLNVLNNVAYMEVVQYMLWVISDILEEDRTRCSLFFQASDKHLASTPNVYTTFLSLLQRPDWYVQQKACELLTFVFEARPDKTIPNLPKQGIENGANGSEISPEAEMASQALTQFVDWCCGQLRRPSVPGQSQALGIHAMSQLLKEAGVRKMFMNAGGVPQIAALLQISTTTPNLQQLYDTCLAVWQLSYIEEGLEAILQQQSIVKGLVEVLKGVSKEKVVRSSLLAFRNILSDKSSAGLSARLLDWGLPKIVHIHKMQNWGDEDITELLEWLEEHMQQQVAQASSFEVYKKEVLSGKLEWGPLHTGSKFWRENLAGFEEKDYQILRVLLSLLEHSHDASQISIVCSDLCHFIDAHPQGRGILTDLGFKQAIMRYLGHKDPEVQRYALRCVQKLMLSKGKLDFIGVAA